MSDKTRWPLCWPDGWPRTAPFLRQHSRFFLPGYPRVFRSMDQSTLELMNELDRLGASDIVLSTNIELRRDGLPRSNQNRVTDPGAAVYFTWNKKPVTLACDKWLRVEDNIWAIVKHIEALRGQDRWGVGTMEQAFRGYMALPGIGDSEASTWWRTLGVPVNSTPDQVKEAYRILVKKHHPDRGGDPEFFRRVMSAMERYETATKNGQ